MEQVRTVSDTKRNFYAHHTRPINSIYRRVVEELLVEMHLLSVNVDFKVDPIFCLGVVTSFDRFMQGYKPERDKDSIFSALCQSVGGEPQKYRQEAEGVLAVAKQKSGEDFVSWMTSPQPTDAGDNLASAINQIANNPQFKYSRLFAIGLYTLLEQADPELVKDQEKRQEVLKKISEALHLSLEKLEKDLDLYRSNLEKMSQVLVVLEEALEAERKKQEKRTSDKLKKEETQENNSP